MKGNNETKDWRDMLPSGPGRLHCAHEWGPGIALTMKHRADGKCSRGIATFKLVTKCRKCGKSID